MEHIDLLGLGFRFRDTLGSLTDTHEQITQKEIDLGEYVLTAGLFEFILNGPDARDLTPADIMSRVVRAAQVPDAESFISHLLGTSVNLTFDMDSDQGWFPSPRPAEKSFFPPITNRVRVALPPIVMKK